MMNRYLLAILLFGLVISCEKQEVKPVQPVPQASVLTCKVYGKGYYAFKSEGGNPQHAYCRDSVTFYSTALPENEISFIFTPDSVNVKSLLIMSIDPAFGDGVYKSTNNKIEYGGL